MRVLVRIYKWMILSILIQLIVIMYFDNFFAEGRKNHIVLTDYNVFDKKENDEVSIEIPSGANRIKLSYDASFVGYYSNEKLEVFDVINEKVVKIINHGEDDINFFKWLPDRNILIYAVKINDDEGRGVQVFTYDASSNIEKDYPRIMTKGTYESEVLDIVLSPLTNVVYTKVKVNDKDAIIYRFNIMEQMAYIMKTNINTKIFETMYADNLLYQENDKIYIRSNAKGTTNQVLLSGRICLLGVDSEDRTYIGEFNGQGQIWKYYYGKIDVLFKNWNEVLLKKPVLSTDVFVSLGGKVQERLEDESCVLEVENNKKIKYKNEFIDITNDYLVTRKDDKLQINKLEK